MLLSLSQCTHTHCDKIHSKFTSTHFLEFQISPVENFNGNCIEWMLLSLNRCTVYIVHKHTLCMASIRYFKRQLAISHLKLYFIRSQFNWTVLPRDKTKFGKKSLEIACNLQKIARNVVHQRTIVSLIHKRNQRKTLKRLEC